MSEQSKINGLVDSTLQNLKHLVDVNTIIGEPIKVDDITIIPVSKVSFGFANGGSDFPTDKPGDLFGGGSGGGVTIQPLAFLVIKPGGVQLLQMAQVGNITERALNMIPETVDKIISLIKKDDKKEDELPPAESIAKSFEDL